MNCIAFCRLFMVAFLFAIGHGSQCCGDEKIDSLVAMLKARANSVNKFSWSFKTSKISGKPSYKNRKGPAEDLVIAHQQDLSTLARNSEHATEGTVFLDVRSGRYKIDRVGRSRWIDGSASELNMFQVFAFDGEVYGSLQRVEPTDPSLAVRNGSKPPVVAEFDSATSDSDTVKALLSSSGLYYLPSQLFTFGFDIGNAELKDPLLQFIDLLETRSEDITFVASGPTDWTVTVSLPGGEGRALRYSFNPEEGGSVSKISLASKRKDSLATEEVVFHNSQYPQGIWGPTRIERYSWVGGIGSEILFNQVNDSPSIAEESFSIHVPVGAQVHDHVSGMSYVVGNGPVDEARAIAEYVGRHRLAIDGNQAVPQRWLRTVVISVFAVASAILVIIRYRRKASSIVVLCICLTSLSSCKRSSDLGHEDVQHDKTISPASPVAWNNGWVVPMGGAQPVPMTQCGFTATAVVLEMLGVKFEPHFIMKELVPTVNGVRFSDMLLALESHGVNVEARKGVALADLVKQLRRDTAAIVAIPSGNFAPGHYAILCRNGLGKVLFVDAPNPPLPIDDVKSILQQNDGLTVLFCRVVARAAELIAETPSVEFDPEDFKGGRLNGKLVAVNDSSRAIAITRVVQPCACIKVDFEPQIVLPGKRIAFSYEVIEASWGNGKQKKEVRFLTATNHSLLFEFVGQSIEKRENPVRQQMLRRAIELPMNCGFGPILHDLMLRLPASEVSASALVEVYELPDWIELKIVEESQGIDLHLSCVLSVERIKKISDGSPVHADFSVSIKSLFDSTYDVGLTFTRELPVEPLSFHFNARSGDSTLIVDPQDLSSRAIANWDISAIHVSSDVVEAKLLGKVGSNEWGVAFDATNALGSVFSGKLVFSNPEHPAIHVPLILMFNK